MFACTAAELPYQAKDLSYPTCHRSADTVAIRNYWYSYGLMMDLISLKILWIEPCGAPLAQPGNTIPYLAYDPPIFLS
jgi:hypothetical protein